MGQKTNIIILSLISSLFFLNLSIVTYDVVSPVRTLAVIGGSVAVLHLIKYTLESITLHVHFQIISVLALITLLTVSFFSIRQYLKEPAVGIYTINALIFGPIVFFIVGAIFLKKENSLINKS